MRQKDKSSRRSLPPAFVLAIAFITGTCVLVLEIVGTRIISPFYGNTIYVWSSLIVVTLIALTGGYAVGGWMADRWSANTTAFYCIGIAGVWHLALPLMRNSVLASTASMGLALGSLVSALLLFSLPLFFLGSVSPQFIRLMTSDVSHVGRRAGSIYAVSTLGSVVGALLAGFYLIPNFGVRTIIFGLAGVLLVVCGVGLFQVQRVKATIGVLIGLASFGFMASSSEGAPDVVFQKESLYGRVQVVDRDDTRHLLINGVLNSSVDLKTGKTGFHYIHLMEMVAYFAPQAKRGILIGMGGGSLAARLHDRYQIVVDNVEIDPVIVEAAERYFDFRPSGEVWMGDGRWFVHQSEHIYDVAMLDAFTSDQQPSHLMSKEFFEELKSKMSPGGVLAINIMKKAGPKKKPSWELVYKTLGEVFAHVRAPSLVFPKKRGPNLGHVILFASDQPLRTDRSFTAYPADVRPQWEKAFKFELKPSQKEIKALPVLTDDYNPIDTHLSPVMVAVREGLIRANTGR